MSKKKIDDGLTKYHRYRLKNLDKYRKIKKEYAKTPEQRKKRNIYMQRWREKNREKSNEFARKSYWKNKYKIQNKQKIYSIEKYGITPEQFEIIFFNQEGKCLICKKIFENKVERRTAHIDHCHETGKIRGLLCSRCNTHLGWFEKYSGGIYEYLLGH